MKVKINEKFICIPPHISTTWDQVSFLHTEEDETSKELILILHLANGKIVKIPRLDSSLIDLAFSTHIRYLESCGLARPTEAKLPGNLFQQLLGLPFDQIGSIKFGIAGLPNNMEGIENAFQHNSAQANAPNLPSEILEKIISIARLFSNGDLNGFPKAEPHCNCVHCQVARAVHGGHESQSNPVVEEEISEEDLKFRSWDIAPLGEKLYTVTNPLDSREQYTVFLGTPIGCTCGLTNCEHVRSVLLS